MAVEETTMKVALADYLDASKKKSPLVKPIEQWMLKKVGPNTRSANHLHPSEVVAKDWCPRFAQMVLESEEPLQMEPPHRFQMQSIFAEGHAIHAKWQGWLGEMGVLYGLWQCLVCANSGWSLGPPTAGRMCNHPDYLYKYLEVPMKDALWESHADGIVMIDRGAPTMIEIKSIGKGTIRFSRPSLAKGTDDLSEMFKQIRTPFEGHVKQVTIYMYLCNQMRNSGLNMYPQIDSAIMLYECKADQGTKEFVVPYDPSLISDILNHTEEIERLRGTGKLVDCPHGGCKKCL